MTSPWNGVRRSLTFPLILEVRKKSLFDCWKVSIFVHQWTANNGTQTREEWLQKMTNNFQTKLGVPFVISGCFYGKYVQITGLEAPGNYSATIWYDKISILLLKNPKFLISMLSGFSNSQNQLCEYFKHILFSKSQKMEFRNL